MQKKLPPYVDIYQTETHRDDPGCTRRLGMPERTADQMAIELAQMDRKGLIDTLRKTQCNFELDFSDDFLKSISIERLRHIALAAHLQADRRS